jgi:tetratricopeptide (TPR) repeat protein
MNTRSFADRNKKSSITHSAGIAPQPRTSQVRASQVRVSQVRVSQVQKRWQPKPAGQRLNSKPTPISPSEHTAPTGDRPGASPLSLAEQTMLLRQQALACAHQGNYAIAIHLFSQLLEQNPHSAIDYSNRGLVYFQTRQVEQALADYDKAIALNPRLDSAYNNRANYYAAQGQYLEAILDYDIALDLNPANVRAWINQGITFRELEMYERALESFDLALCLDRLEGHIYAERGRTYHLRGDWNCAIADYQRASAKLPQFAESVSDAVIRLRLQIEGWTDELSDSVVEKNPRWRLN